MPEPRYLIIDTETGRRVEITTDELQALVWRMELQQPLDGDYFESSRGHDNGFWTSVDVVEGRKEGCS